MSKGKRFDDEAQLNYKKVAAVAIAVIVVIMAIVIIKNIITKANNTTPVEVVSYYALYQDEKWGILGSDGETVITPMYQEMPIIVDSSKDVFLLTYDVNEADGTYKTKVVNSKNEEILTNYDKVEALENYDESGNVWYEENVLKVEKDGKWGLINLDGEELIALEYDSITTLKGIENSLIVSKDGSYGLVNNKGAKVISTEYSQILSFGDEYKDGYITVNSEGKYGIVSYLGNTILENEYEKIEDIYGEKYFVISENGSQKLIDSDGNEILSSNFDEIKQIANSGIVFTSGSKYGLMDFEGNILIEAIYDNLEEINTDVFSATKDGLVGAIDKDGIEKIGFSFVDVYYVSKAGIYVADDSEYNSSILNSSFEIKIKGILSEIDADNGYMKLKIDNEYKYYNFKFEEKTAQDLLVSNKLFLSKQDGKYGYVDSKGNVVVDYIYDDATEFNSYGYAAVKKDGVWGSIDSNGDVVIEPYYNLDNNLKIDFIGKYYLGLDINMNYYTDN